MGIRSESGIFRLKVSKPGHYRPGSCAPYYIEPLPISCRGALFQAGAVVGTAAILP
jgi:hypothetical protein